MATGYATWRDVEECEVTEPTSHATLERVRALRDADRREADELRDLAINAKRDAYAYGGNAIMTPGTEADRLLGFVFVARTKLADGMYMDHVRAIDAAK